MRPTRDQFLLLILTAVFFGLQCLPHYITGLHNSDLSYFYIAIAILIVATILGGVVVALVAVIASRGAAARKRPRSWLATFGLMLLVGGGVAVANTAFGRGLPVGSFARRFDQRLWAEAPSSAYVANDITNRQKMLGDVIRTVVRNNHKESIIKILGPSEDPDYFASSGRDLIYRTGPQRDSMFAIDSEWLLIWFGADGRVSRYEVWSD